MICIPIKIQLKHLWNIPSIIIDFLVVREEKNIFITRWKDKSSWASGDRARSVPLGPCFFRTFRWYLHRTSKSRREWRRPTLAPPRFPAKILKGFCKGLLTTAIPRSVNHGSYVASTPGGRSVGCATVGLFGN